ncbi:MAG: hypothetical protein CMN04_10210 [Roseibacillus sp.]|nr:hypothetical protein [Roseibacillus sp.]
MIIFPRSLPAAEVVCYWSYVLEVVCAVLIRNHRILVCQRAPGKHLAGSWEFPGGKLEKGENLEAALRREIVEELKCSIGIDEALASVEHHYPHLSINLHAFSCHLSPGSPDPSALEHTSIRWIGCEEVEELDLAGADQRLWRMIASKIGSICSPDSQSGGSAYSSGPLAS